MKRLVALGSSFLLAGFFMLPASASAQGAYNTNTGCGLGNMLFQEIGQDKILFQVFAVTTNGTFGNQTFGITSGTLGCKQPSRFVFNEKLNNFVAENMDSLAQDIAAGNGESLATVAELMDVPQDRRAAFYSSLQARFGEIYPSAAVQSADVIETINRIASNS